MTETSYTAWDDKLYEWPPPDGWYRANDGKWWPEGYGPGPDGAASDGSAAGATGSTANEPDEAADTGIPETAGPVGNGSHGAVATDWSSDWSEQPSPNGSASFDADPAPAGSFGSVLGSESSSDEHGSTPGDGFPSADETMVAGSDLLAGLTAATSELPQGFSGFAPEQEDRSAEPIAEPEEWTFSTDDAVPPTDEAPSAEPSSEAPPQERPEPEFLFGSEREGAITDLDALPPPMVADPGSAGDLGLSSDLGLSGEPAPSSDAGLADRAFTAPEVEAASHRPPADLDDAPDDEIDARPTESFVPEGVDPAFGGAPLAEQPTGMPPGPLDWGQQPPPPDQTMIAPPPPGSEPSDGGFPAPAATGQLFNAPPSEAPPSDAPPWGGAPPPGAAAPPPPSGGPLPGSFDAPPGPAPAPGWAQQPYGQPDGGQQFPTGFDQGSMPSSGSTGFSRKVMLAALGVLVLVAVGAVLYMLLSGGDDDTGGTGEGSFGTPHARATGVEISYGAGDADRQWVVEVLEPVRDASAEATSVPDDGEVFAATRIRIRNEAAELSAPLGELQFNAVTPDGEVIDRADNDCSVGDDLDFGAALPPSGSVEGTVCWQTPAEALGGLLLGIESTEVGGRVHIALQ